MYAAVQGGLLESDAARSTGLLESDAAEGMARSTGLLESDAAAVYAAVARSTGLLESDAAAVYAAVARSTSPRIRCCGRSRNLSRIKPNPLDKSTGQPVCIVLSSCGMHVMHTRGIMRTRGRWGRRVGALCTQGEDGDGEELRKSGALCTQGEDGDGEASGEEGGDGSRQVAKINFMNAPVPSVMVITKWIGAADGRMYCEHDRILTENSMSPTPIDTLLSNPTKSPQISRIVGRRSRLLDEKT